MGCLALADRRLIAFWVRAYKVPDEAGADLQSVLSLTHTVEPATCKLSAEICNDHDRESYELKAHAGEQPKGNDKGNWRMDRQKPGERKFPHIRPPVSERNVQKENKECNRQQIHNGLQKLIEINKRFYDNSL